MGRAAKRYAKAILNYALEQKKEAQVHDDMMLIATTIKESADLQVLLGSPVIKSEVKKAGLTEVFGSKVSDLSVSFLCILIRNFTTRHCKLCISLFVESSHSINGLCFFNSLCREAHEQLLVGIDG